MKVLMVCLGNICRSPLAEGILKDKVNKASLPWIIDSAGTSNWHVGHEPHQGSISIAMENGINISGQKARQFEYADFDNYDLILAMDSDNYQNIKKMSTTKNQLDKVKLILNFAYPNKNMAVPDPYYTGNFEEVFSLINLACENIISEYSN